MYSDPRPLDSTRGDLVFHAEPVYPGRPLRKLVPIVAIEAFTLAASYPIVWRRVGAGGHELCAFRGIDEAMPDSGGAADPPPLLVEAYPLTFAWSSREGAGRYALMIDGDPPPERVGGVGALEEGRPSEAFVRRVRALQVFASDVRRTEAMTEALAAAGLLEDWAPRLHLPDGVRELRGLAVLVGEGRRASLPDLVERFGLELARLVTAHDLSLFKMQRLVEAAREREASARRER